MGYRHWSPQWMGYRHWSPLPISLFTLIGVSGGWAIVIGLLLPIVLFTLIGAFSIWFRLGAATE